MVPDDQHHKLTLPNKVGNTILHEASTSNKLVHAAVEMLNKAPELLNMRNKAGVTPLYRSVQFGRMKMFRFLDEQSRQRMQQTTFREVYYNDKNKTTVLHAAVVNGSFDLALLIAEKYKRLVNEKDNNKMTALQLLACNSLAFEGRGSGRYLKRPKCLKCSRDLTEEMSFDRKGVLTDEVSSDSEAGCWRVPYWEEIQKERKRYESALKLTKFLIKEDRSWKETKALENQNDPTYHTFDPSLQSSASLSEKEENKTEIPDKPLILATMHGYVEMVEEILKEYPWAVEYVDQQGRTILHVAIKYRQIKVLDRVEQMGVLKRLGRKVDNKSNTILHMVGEKTEDRIVRQVRGPAFELQENLLLFERVRKMCPSSLRNTLNDDNKTAQKLFEDTNEPLRVTANEWLKQTAQNCSLVAVLIATVAFAAAYTIPGGSNQSGFPILLNRPFFVVFTMTDVLSLTFALTSVIIFLRILTSPFRLEDFKQPLPQMLMLGITFLIVSVTMMMVAFAATVILMIHNRGEWTKIALYTASFLPVFIFAVSYLPLYLNLVKTFNYSLDKVVMIFPRFNKSKLEQIVTSNSKCPSKLRASPNLV
ncbi:hypothetical protein Vadar_033714 [Vaccinium darrowii]|uniref:Uncharacterized protein n=1 Tax=Vaccinium darrowii TaxID=229202 RepID=A0ACB7Z993_9ERIC|nr:hypothetical protein Vadar_033714 [Vaccinium darrowii]